MSLTVLLYFELLLEKAAMLTKHDLHVLPAAVYIARKYTAPTHIHAAEQVADHAFSSGRNTSYKIAEQVSERERANTWSTRIE